MMRIVLQLMLFPFPWSIRRRIMKALLRYEIDSTAKIGWSIVLATRVVMAPGARIGHLTVIKGLSRLELGEKASLGNLNWVTGTPSHSSRHFVKDICREPSLIIERHAAITHRHLIDCTDRVSVGEFTTVAGWGSQILTHAIDLEECRQSASPVKIGAHCFIGTRVVLLKGSEVPDNSVLAAGSVLGKPMKAPGHLYGGIPAELVRPISPTAAYFSRTIGFVE